MTDCIEMTADEPSVPSFGGGATRVLSENELDGLLEATVSATDIHHPRAPKETKRIEALARIEPVTPGVAAPESGASTAATEAALLDAAYSGAVIAVAASTTAHVVSTRAPGPDPGPDPGPVTVARVRSRRSWAMWIALIVAASLGAAAVLSMLR